MATLQFKRGAAFIDPQIGEPFLDTEQTVLKIGISGSDFITILDSGSLATNLSPIQTSITNLNSFTQSFNTAISLDSSNVTILGNLDVQGTTTTIDSTTITLGDNIIELNGTGAANGGILVNDVTNPNTLSGSLLWDGTNDYWKAGQLGNENEIITTANIVSNLPTNTISGSSQIDHDQTTNYSAAEHFLQSEITTVGTVTVGSVTAILPSGTVSGSSQIDITGGLPSGTVSGSSQIDVTQTTNYSSINQYTDSDFDTRFGTKSTTDLSEGTNEYYTDTKVKTKLDTEGVISGSSQVDVTQTTNYSSINQYTDSDTQDYLDSIGVVSGSISGQLPSGTVSGSEQIDHDLTLNFSPAEHFTQENITTVGTITTGNIDSILPTGTVSGSSQIDVTQTTNYSSINQYTDSDTQDYIDSIGLVSGSVSGQLPSGTVSGSSQIDVTQTTNYSSIEQYTDSDNQSYIDSIGLLSGSSQVNMGGDISGDATNTTVEKVQGVSLTSGEATQLANIDTNTISNTQWGYLGVMNQNVRTTDNVTFNTGSFTGDVTINGNFTVLGSATEIATTELTVEDKLITIASGSVDSAAANGAGIFIDGANESITWNHSNSRFNISDDLNVEGNMTVTGDVVAFSSSDRRFKDNLTQIVTPLSKLSRINGYSFNWNTDKQHIYKGKDYGVVAQEIQEVLPELVQERENGYLAVNYEKLVPLLIESIKELKTQIDHLNKKLEK